MPRELLACIVPIWFADRLTHASAAKNQSVDEIERLPEQPDFAPKLRIAAMLST